ncbi:MAG: histidine kinase, partial [Campylobacter hyointestinalis]
MRYNFKFLISLFVVLYIIMTVLVFNFYIGLALKDAKQGALYILDTTNSVRDYISNVQRPVINELKEKKLLNDDFFDPRLMSASYITKEIY